MLEAPPTPPTPTNADAPQLPRLLKVQLRLDRQLEWGNRRLRDPIDPASCLQVGADAAALLRAL
ncbi:hypothetical protein H9L39_01531 [Fusarium oxysporum f. sp. albedinis]|nr:hypothetical protein H9L39_01531 [Fusarium oxysporum f. sp. albedinis]